MTASISPNTSDLSTLVSLLERQLALYRGLSELSAQQSATIEQGEPEPLLNVLASRQRVIEDLTGVNRELEPYRKRWDDLWASLAESDRGRIGDLVRAVQQLLTQIIAQDERDRSALQAAKNRVGAEVQRISRAGAAVQAYRSTPTAGQRPQGGIAQGNNRFMNQQG